MIQSLVIYIRAIESLTAEMLVKIDHVCKSMQPSHREHFLLKGVLVTYSEGCLKDFGGPQAVITAFTEALKSEEVTIGASEGKVIGLLDSLGQFSFGPLGDVVNTAMQLAVRKQEP